MADHVRKQLRGALATALGALTTTGSRVHGYRVSPLQLTQLPALSIRVTDETVEQATVHANALQEREIEVRVMGIADGATPPDDTLDQIAKEVEIALSAVLTISGKKVQCFYRGCEISFEDGERAVGVIDLRYVAKVYTAANAPDVFS